MVSSKNRLAGGEAPLLCRQHWISQGPARADARRSTGRSPRRGRGGASEASKRNAVREEKNAFFILPPEAGYPRIGPDVGAVAARSCLRLCSRGFCGSS